MDLFIKSMLPQLKELWLTWEKEDDGHFDLSLLDVSQLTELSFRVSMKITVDSSGCPLSGPELCSKISAICHKNSATLQEVAAR
jgi:hypothetical protein